MGAIFYISPRIVNSVLVFFSVLSIAELPLLSSGLLFLFMVCLCFPFYARGFFSFMYWSLAVHPCLSVKTGWKPHVLEQVLATGWALFYEMARRQLFCWRSQKVGIKYFWGEPLNFPEKSFQISPLLSLFSNKMKREKV